MYTVLMYTVLMYTVLMYTVLVYFVLLYARASLLGFFDHKFHKFEQIQKGENKVFFIVNCINV